jgi:hypothetical protein
MEPNPGSQGHLEEFSNWNTEEEVAQSASDGYDRVVPPGQLTAAHRLVRWAQGVEFCYSAGYPDGMLKPGNDDRQERPGYRRKVLLVYAFVLGSSAILFFLGGFLLRNPNALPYFRAAIESWWKPKTRGPDAPTTAADYLKLSHRNLTDLSPEQKPIARELADLARKVSEIQGRLDSSKEAVQEQLPRLKTADALSAYTGLKAEAAKLASAAGRQKAFFEGLEDWITERLKTRGLSSDMAGQVAALFCQRVNAQDAINQAAKLQGFASELLCTAELLAETPGQWTVFSNGEIRSKDPKLEEEYREHQTSLVAAMQVISGQ